MDLALFDLDSPFWAVWIPGALAVLSWLAIGAGGLFAVLAVMVTHPPEEPREKAARRGCGLIGW